MPSLIVHHLQQIDTTLPISSLSSKLDGLEKQCIAQQSWPAYSYKPEVFFKIGHTADCILLKYFVREQSIRAVNTAYNTPVYEDTCVEFFIAFDEKGYYNFEFNCIGTALAAYGKGRNDRQFMDAASISSIQSEAKIKTGKAELYEWSLTLAIPVSIFYHHRITSLKGLQCKANFYKCGDLLPQPHFLSWAPITAPEPNFHLPLFFGNLQFQ